jgi:hypothetical protein
VIGHQKYVLNATNNTDTFWLIETKGSLSRRRICSQRGYNIETLNVALTDDLPASRLMDYHITFSVRKQIIKTANKPIEVPTGYRPRRARNDADSPCYWQHT